MNETQPKPIGEVFADAEFHLLRIQTALDLANHLFDAGFGISLITDLHVRVYLSTRRLYAHEVQQALTDDFDPFVFVKAELNSVLITILH